MTFGERAGQFLLRSAQLRPWLLGELKLERCTTSRFPDLLSAMLANRVAFDAADLNAPSLGQQIMQAIVGDQEQRPYSYVVAHDWASALAGSEGYDGGEFMLPGANCNFEFQLSGRSIIALLADGKTDGSPGLCCMVYAEGDDGWWIAPYGFNADVHAWEYLAADETSPVAEAFRNVCALVYRQTKAACVMLEAQAAVTEVVRFPERTQRKQLARGQVPSLNYHVVKLDRRHRAQPVPEALQSVNGRKVRLHFRRGHWRHFENHRTWIRWCLVGDPDLGFVDKHYTL